jgi:hypothetical protein
MQLKKYSNILAQPMVLLCICIIAFSLQISKMGFTLDDWIILYNYKVDGLYGLMEYSFLDDRPLVFWTWYLGFKLLGMSPIKWQIWTIGWRFLSVLFFWLSLRQFFNAGSQKPLLTALMFAVYPVFFQQPSAIAYGFHWIGFSFFMLSIYLMIKSIQKKEKYFFFSVLAVISASISLFTQEYFTALELIRFLIIWLLLQNQNIVLSKKIKKTFYYWLPYLLLLFGNLIWRFIFMPTAGADRNAPQLLTSFLKEPLQTLLEFVVLMIRDLLNIVFGVWYNTIKPEVIALQPNSILLSWIVTAIVFLGLLILILWKSNTQQLNDDGTNESFRFALIFGLIATILGLLPGWMIGRSISDSSGLYNDRFGLAAMPGVSILVVTLVFTMLKKKSTQIVALCLMISLSCGTHFRSNSTYRWSWKDQLQLYWQLKWRMPELKTPVAIYGDGALVKFIGGWSNTSAFNIVYQAEKEEGFVPYWYFDLYKVKISHQVENKDPVKGEVFGLRFKGNWNDAIVIQTKALPKQCVWVVDQNDAGNLYLTDQVRYALPLSNFEKIDPVLKTTPDPVIFGQEIAHDWCYYYQKADLAHQFGDWETILDLWNQAETKGHDPYNGQELMIFIEAAAHLEQWALAMDLSQRSTFITEDIRDSLCMTWDQLNVSLVGEGVPQPVRDQLNEKYDCKINR